jgi:peptidoglycan hydrolase CwlO-like protein
MERDYSTPDSIREEYEADLRWERTRRRHQVFTAALILLAAGLVGVAWYGYSILGRHDVTLTQFPSTVTDVQKGIFSLGEQAKATDAKVDDWSTRQEELRGQLNKARGDLMARVDAVKKQAGEASAALFERVRSEVATQMDGVKTQLARLETSRETDRQQIAQLQQELTKVRGQVQQQGQELASVQGKVEQNATSTDREIAAVKTTQQRDRGDFDAYADKFAVKRVDFEVTKNHSTSVAPGISLQVNATDVSYQKVSGSVLTPDNRTIWLRQLKVQEPVFLTSFADGRTRELVITRVNKTGAVGYVLMPSQDTVTSRAAATSPINNPLTSQARGE